MTVNKLKTESAKIANDKRHVCNVKKMFHQNFVILRDIRPEEKTGKVARYEPPKMNLRCELIQFISFLYYYLSRFKANSLNKYVNLI